MINPFTNSFELSWVEIIEIKWMMLISVLNFWFEFKIAELIQSKRNHFNQIWWEQFNVNETKPSWTNLIESVSIDSNYCDVIKSRDVETSSIDCSRWLNVEVSIKKFRFVSYLNRFKADFKLFKWLFDSGPNARLIRNVQLMALATVSRDPTTDNFISAAILNIWL